MENDVRTNTSNNANNSVKTDANNDKHGEPNTTAAAFLAKFSLRKPVTVTILFISLLLLGGISSRLLPLELFPGIEIPEIFVNVPYPNATPAEVERQITKPIEEALATISGIQNARSWSSESGANIGLSFKWGENISSKSIEAREKIDAIRDQLPDDVERLFVFQFNTSDMPVLNLRISSDRDLSFAYDLLDRQLKRQIERVPGVSQVTMYGVNKREIVIRLDENRLAAYKIPVSQVLTKLRGMNFSQSAGYLNTAQGKILVTPNGEFTSVADVKNAPITDSVLLGDIANINYELPEREDGRHLHQTYAIGMDVMKESSANLVQVASGVLEVVEQAKSNPQFNGINLFVMQNTAKDVTSSLGNLLEAGLIGAVLSVIVLFLFLRHLMTTLIVVASVPIAICITLGAMYLLGYSLNILSLMGLMLAVGMLVDNAVVVTESIYTERQKGHNIHKATEKGVNNVALAVIAGTCTTAIVFLPNIIGKKIDVTIFLEHVAIAICISLFASLIISQTLIPLLTSKIKKLPELKKDSVGQARYHKMLTWVMSNQKKSFFIGLALFLSLVIPMQMVQSNEEGGVSKSRMFINYNIQGNASIEDVEKKVDIMEKFLYDNKDRFEFESVYSYYRSGFAQSTINMNAELSRSFIEIKNDIEAEWPVIVGAEPTFGWNSGNGGGLRVSLAGPSTDVLLELADQTIPLLSNIEGLEDVRSEITGDQKEIQVIIDRDKVQRYGLDSMSVAQAASTALRGLNLRTYRDPVQGEIQVRLRFDDDIKHNLEKFKSLIIISKNGVDYRLEQLAELKVTPRLNQIFRRFRETNLAIGANLGKDFTLEEAEKQITAVMNQLTLPTGYRWSLTGSFERAKEAENIMLVNMALALVMIYIVMAALFESLILPTAVITSLLFSISGTFWALLITGTDMGIMVMIGILILMGIVVNNGIVLIDKVNQLREHGHSLYEAVIEGSVSRFRPILMTVATTVLGLLPLAMGDASIGGNGSPEYAPMAIAIIGGLLFSTIMSLLFVPLAYVLLLKLADRTTRMFNRGKEMANKVIAES